MDSVLKGHRRHTGHDGKVQHVNIGDSDKGKRKDGTQVIFL